MVNEEKIIIKFLDSVKDAFVAIENEIKVINKRLDSLEKSQGYASNVGGEKE